MSTEGIVSDADNAAVVREKLVAWQDNEDGRYADFDVTRAFPEMTGRELLALSEEGVLAAFPAQYQSVARAFFKLLHPRTGQAVSVISGASLRPADEPAAKRVRNEPRSHSIFASLTTPSVDFNLAEVTGNPIPSQPFIPSELMQQCVAEKQAEIMQLWANFKSATFAEQLRAEGKPVKSDDDEETVHVYHPFFEQQWRAMAQLLRAALASRVPSVQRNHILVHTYEETPYATSKHRPDFSLVMDHYAATADLLTSDEITMEVFSFAVGAFIEMKKSRFDDDDYRQALEYGRRLLLDQPLRTHVYVALCNNKTIQLLLVSRSAITSEEVLYTSFQPVALSSPAGVYVLAGMMESDLSYQKPLTVPIPTQPTPLVALYLLGRGAAATVFSACFMNEFQFHQPPSFAMKLYERQDIADHERLVLNELLSVDGVPRIVQSVRRPSLIINVVQPLAEESVGRHKLSAAEICELIDTLKLAHARNWICRDVRPENIMRHGGRAYLIDWNAATRSTGSPVHVAGTALYASNRVLQAILDKSRIIYTPAEDLIALAKVVLAQRCDILSGIASLSQHDKPAAALKAWKAWGAVFDQAPFLVAAQDCDYDGMKARVCKFLL